MVEEIDQVSKKMTLNDFIGFCLQLTSNYMIGARLNWFIRNETGIKESLIGCEINPEVFISPIMCSPKLTKGRWYEDNYYGGKDYD